MYNIYLSIKEKLALLVSDYMTEYVVFILALIGLGLLLVALFLPKKIQLHKIDLKRMLDKKKPNVTMSKRIRYFHTLSKTGIFRLFQLDEESKKYKDYETKIDKAGGLEGCTPDVIYMFKWLFFFSHMTVLSGLFLISSIVNPDVIVGKNLFVACIMFALFGYMVPNIFLNRKIKERRKEFLVELDTIELFTVIYLRAGYNVYDLLVALSEVSNHTNKYINECINEFYINQEVALQNLANKIKIEEYQLLIDILKQATRISGVNMVEFVESHTKQLKKIKDLAIQEQNKKRPLKYAFILALPLIGVLILWFYPLMVKAMKMFTDMGTI